MKHLVVVANSLSSLVVLVLLVSVFLISSDMSIRRLPLLFF